MLASFFRAKMSLAAPLSDFFAWVRERSTHAALRTASDGALQAALQRVADAGDIMIDAENATMHNLA